MLISEGVLLWFFGVILTLIGMYVASLLRNIDKSLQLRDQRIESIQTELTEHKNYCGRKFDNYDTK